jgi:type III restriction enzyme
LETVERAFLGKGAFRTLAKASEAHRSFLKESIELREYQEDALGRFIYYLDEYKDRPEQLHLMFNMATGSGKTVLMAALIAELYNRGFRRFLFFTRLSNIVDKTRINFISNPSGKYIFNSRIENEGAQVRILEVDKFSTGEIDHVEIVFKTTGALHEHVHNPKENGLYFDSETPIVLLADEAHNLSSMTLASAQASSDELFATDWESTVNGILKSNMQNCLLEFTATARLDSAAKEILDKYRDKALVKYDLKQFRLDGYSKDIETFELDLDVLTRSLTAMVLSQFRLRLALEFGINLKPVVLFKANRVSVGTATDLKDDTKIVSSIFKQSLNSMVQKLDGNQIDQIRKLESEHISRAFDFFDQIGLTSRKLALEIQHDFSQNRILSVDDDEDLHASGHLLNTLEDQDNPIRAIIATEKLNEGWDVLNLFDIVRLYNTRDAKSNKPGAKTVQEAQLVGRGARYWPFDYETLPADKRKFDSDISNDLRFLELMTYHSKTNSRYIQELRAALVESGILAERYVEATVEVKESVRTSDFWKGTPIFLNSLVKRSSLATGVEGRHQSVNFEPDFPPNIFNLGGVKARETMIFDSDAASAELIPGFYLELQALNLNLKMASLASSKLGTLKRLKSMFGPMESRQDFIENPKFLGKLKCRVRGASGIEQLTEVELFAICSFVIRKVLESASTTTTANVGSREFEPKSLDEVFGKTKTLKLDESANAERLRPFADANLSQEEWFAQNEIWGTSEEKELLRFILANLSELRTHFASVLLVRNEMHFPIYSFQDGAAFYPDFVLFLEDRTGTSMGGLQVFLEPKGDQFLDSQSRFTNSRESWKQNLLTTLEERAIVSATSGGHAVIGLPFFNSGKKNAELLSAFQAAFSQLMKFETK